ncbi:MAG: four helix bundle protein [Sedimentisphaerales bacterium]|nr:four helix bundle protein [Sedimentisphaerales bacterium]
MAESIAQKKSYDFALKIIHLCIRLKEQKHFEIASQLLRAGTGIGANVEEALAGHSRKDFAAKMCIASKEAREANYWLRLLTDAVILNGERGEICVPHRKNSCGYSRVLLRQHDVARRSLGPMKRQSDKTKNSKLRTQNYDVGIY